MSSSRLSRKDRPLGSYDNTFFVRSGVDREFDAKTRRATRGKRLCGSSLSSSSSVSCFGSSVGTRPFCLRTLPAAMAMSFWLISSLVKK